MSSVRLFSWKLMIQATETSPLSSSSSSTSLHFSPPCGLVLFGQTSERIRMKWIPKRPTHTHTHWLGEFLSLLSVSFLVVLSYPVQRVHSSCRHKGDARSQKGSTHTTSTAYIFFFASIGCLWAFHWPPLISILFTKLKIKKNIYIQEEEEEGQEQQHTHADNKTHTQKKKNVPSLFGRSWPVLLLI